MESLRKKENNEAQVLNNVKRWICKNCLHSQIELLKRDLSEPKTDRERERENCVFGCTKRTSLNGWKGLVNFTYLADLPSIVKCKAPKYNR